ncbi:formylglycine-generating enzyme family protein, partial [Myxococcota bacterium]|nr:formylglycine-generating enzyme family protein [Myxococcota bacterium]
INMCKNTYISLLVLYLVFINNCSIFENEIINSEIEKYISSKANINNITYFLSFKNQQSIKYKILNKTSGTVITYKVPSLGMELVLVEEGSFMMGSSIVEVYNNTEAPLHKVTLKNSFWIGKYEVTQKEYLNVMGNNPSNFKGIKKPVEKVDWFMAKKFCEILTIRERKAGRLWGKMKFRLPTEEEWEYAALGGNKSKNFKYSGSNNLDEVGWYDDNSYYSTHDVGQKKSNELGLYDMSGNVFEWCENVAHSYKDKVNMVQIDEYEESSRAVRSCGFLQSDSWCRIKKRYSGEPFINDSYHGFRIVLVYE